MTNRLKLKIDSLALSFKVVAVKKLKGASSLFFLLPSWLELISILKHLMHTTLKRKVIEKRQSIKFINHKISQENLNFRLQTSSVNYGKTIYFNWTVSHFSLFFKANLKIKKIMLFWDVIWRFSESFLSV